LFISKKHQLYSESLVMSGKASGQNYSHAAELPHYIRAHLSFIRTISKGFNESNTLDNVEMPWQHTRDRLTAKSAHHGRTTLASVSIG